MQQSLGARGPDGARFTLESDPESLRKFRAGDRAVLKKVYRAYAPAVFAYLRSQARSAADAGDLMREVFLAAFAEDTRKHFNGSAPFDRFLLGIARNRVLHCGLHRADAVDAIVEILGVGVELAGRIGPKEILQGFVHELDDEEWAFFRRELVHRRGARPGPPLAKKDEPAARSLRMKLLRYLKRAGYLATLESPRRGPLTATRIAWSA